MSQINQLSPEQVEQYENPVSFCAKGENVWHIPVIEDGTVHFLCGRGGRGSSIGASEHEFFMRRRHASQCKACAHRAESNADHEIEVKQ